MSYSRDRLLEWPLRLAFVVSLVVVWESNRPWATGLIREPRAGSGDETLFTVVAGFVAVAAVIYRWYRPFTSWRFMWVPTVAYGLASVITAYDWVRVASIPPDSDVVLWGLQYDIRTTWDLWATAIASWIGLVMSAIQLALDRQSDIRRRRSDPSL